MTKSKPMAASAAPALERTYHGIAARLDRLPDGAWQNGLTLMAGGIIFCGGYSQYLGSGLFAYWLDNGWSTPELNANCVSLTMLGYLLGSILMGFVSDLRGRRMAILASLLIVAVTSFLASFAPDMQAMIIIRFFMGIGMGGCILSTYCVLAEYTPPRSRGRYAAETGLVGNFSLPIAALLTMGTSLTLGWRALCGVGFSLAMIMFFVIWRYFPESPRWLASQGRFDDADAIVGKAEKTFLEKGFKLDSIDAEEVARATARTARPSSPLRMLLHPNTLRRTVALAAALFAMNVLVYSVTTWTPTVFVTNGMPSTLSIAVTFVIGLGAPFGIFLLMVFADKHGRKAGLVTCLLVLTVASYIWSLIPVNNAVAMMLYGFALCSVLYYYSLLACSVYIGEQFPTCVRARGAGIANAIGRIASVGAPYLIFVVFSSTGVASVYVLSAGICLVAAALVAALGVETRYRSLEDINDRNA